MSRQRFIHPEFFESESIGSLPHGARLLFAAMFTLADDLGRGKAGARQLRAMAFRYDEMPLETVEVWASLLAEKGMVRFYSANGCPFYDIPNWDKWQKPKYIAPSKIPPPEITKSLSGSSPEYVPLPATGRVGKGRVVIGQGGEGKGGEQAVASAVVGNEDVPANAAPRSLSTTKTKKGNGFRSLGLEEAAAEASPTVKRRLEIEIAVVKEHPDWTWQQQREEIARRFNAKPE